MEVLFEESLEELWAPCSRYSRDGGPWSAPSPLSSVPGAQAYSRRSPPLKHGTPLNDLRSFSVLLGSALLTSQLCVQENRVITSAGQVFSARFCQSCFRLKTRWLSDVLRRLSRPSNAHKHEHEMCNYGQRSHKLPGPLIDFHTLLWSGDTQMILLLFSFSFRSVIRSFIGWFVLGLSVSFILSLLFCLFIHSLEVQACSSETLL